MTSHSCQSDVRKRDSAKGLSKTNDNSVNGIVTSDVIGVEA